MKKIHPYILLLVVWAPSTYAVDLNLEFAFGGSASIEEFGVGHLLVDQTADGSADFSALIGSNLNITSNGAGPTAVFTPGDIIGEFMVLSAAINASDFTSNGDFGFATPALSYSTTLLDPDIVAGRSLAMLWIQNSGLYGFTGSMTADVSNGGTIGWSLPVQGASDTLIDLATDVGGRVDFSNLDENFKIGIIVPEPSSLSLCGMALVLIGCFRNRQSQ